MKTLLKNKLQNLTHWQKAILGIPLIPLFIIACPFILLYIMGRIVIDIVEDFLNNYDHP